MTADVQRELAEALRADAGLDEELAGECAQVVAPTVQRLIADAEKRAAAAALREAAEKIKGLASGPVPAIADPFDAVVILRAEADRAALDAAATVAAVGAFLLHTLDCCDHPEAG